MCQKFLVFEYDTYREMRPQEALDVMDKEQSIEEKTTKKGLVANIFDVANIKEGFQSVFKYRPNNLRTYVIILTIVFILEIFLFQSGKFQLSRKYIAYIVH